MGREGGGAKAEAGADGGGSAMEEPRCLRAERTFQHGPHTLRLLLTRSRLEVEVEAHLTADQWRGEFDASYIEELTHKTGNFKQFGIFCSMLESALTQSSESVSLELLTYADLEALRSRKAGGIPRPPPASASPLSTKRYLILIYSVEFDRIHYPLPLPHAGRPDPAALRALVRDLRDELVRLRLGRGDHQIQQLREELQRALGEKRAAEAALQRERNRHQRHQRQLENELAEAKASERRLQQRVKDLTAQLASCKRGPSQGFSSRRTPSGVTPERRSPAGTRSPSPRAPRPPRFDPTAFVRARQKEAELKKSQRRGATLGSASPARSRGRSSSAGSFRSQSSAEEHCEAQAPRRVTRTRRPLSASSCNGPRMTSCPPHTHRPALATAASKRPGKENRQEEPELAEIDARLRALQEYMDRLDPHL